MKKLILITLCLGLILNLSSCRSCTSDFEQRRKGVQKVCPTCIYTYSEHDHYAQDTSKQPNIVYKVTFCTGGLYYNAWNVDHLTKVQ